MALMSNFMEWRIIRTAVKELLFHDNMLFEAQKNSDDANRLVQARQVELGLIETKLKSYQAKQGSSSARKQHKYINLEAQQAEATNAVALATQESNKQSKKLGRASRSRVRREERVNSVIEKFQPNGRHVLVMELADITSIRMMRDCGKKLHFALGKSVRNAEKVAIDRAARKIKLYHLSSGNLVYMDGTTFHALTVPESEARGLRV